MSRGDWDEPEYELHQTVGEASSLIYPDDIAFFSDEERDAWRDEIRARQQRKRPVGFTAWKAEPADQPVPLRIVS